MRVADVCVFGALVLGVVWQGALANEQVKSDIMSIVLHLFKHESLIDGELERLGVDGDRMGAEAEAAAAFAAALAQAQGGRQRHRYQMFPFAGSSNDSIAVAPPLAQVRK